jgi:hypothetical protein
VRNRILPRTRGYPGRGAEAVGPAIASAAAGELRSDDLHRNGDQAAIDDAGKQRSPA